MGYFNPLAFVENLKWMGIGMLGVFVIIGVIIAATYVTNASINKFEQNRKNKD